MSERVEALKAFANVVFGRFDNAVKDLKESEIDWRPVEEANSIRWILTHLSQEWSLNIPRALKGDFNYKPSGWPDDYVGNRTYSLEKVMADLAKGRAGVLEELGKLHAKDLDVSLTTPRGVRKRGEMLMMLISEIAHHEGQIAYIRGAIGRRRQKSPSFLT